VKKIAVKKVALPACVWLAITTLPALAHSGHGPSEGFLSGFHHPFTGLDHLLAMVAVGVWAAMRGGTALWGWPAAFVGAMVAGFALAVHGVVLPLYEPMILASLIGLGVVIMLGVRMPVLLGAAMVAIFGLFHGYAHGIEITGSALAFAAGFIAASIVLHCAGIAAGAFALGVGSTLSLRIAGAATALAGIVLASTHFAS
jgi:urease accessory protein